MGAGWYNGFGGKVEGGENIEEAAKREVYGECGVKVKNQIIKSFGSSYFLIEKLYRKAIRNERDETKMVLSFKNSFW